MKKNQLDTILMKLKKYLKNAIKIVKIVYQDLLKLIINVLIV